MGSLPRIVVAAAVAVALSPLVVVGCVAVIAGAGATRCAPVSASSSGEMAAGAMDASTVAGLLAQAGFSGEPLVVMLATGIGESGLRVDAQGDLHLVNGTWGPSVGFFQIRTLHSQTGSGGFRDIQALLADPAHQAAAAYSISGGGANFGPWTVYQTGAYRDHLDQARAAAGTLVDSQGATPIRTAPVCTPATGLDAATGLPDGPVGIEETVVVSNGVRVHASIAGQVDALILAARADGVVLAGGGWRSTESQWALRRAHCPDPANSPASACSPPTAIPGSSMHERGLAIDFTYGGSTIRSRSNPGYVWLAGHADEYGLHNLPSEPWHWSTNGK